MSELLGRLRDVEMSDGSASLLAAAAGLGAGGGLVGVTGVWWMPIAAAVAVTVAALLPVRPHNKHRRH